jgi:TolB-like protein
MRVLSTLVAAALVCSAPALAQVPQKPAAKAKAPTMKAPAVKAPKRPAPPTSPSTPTPVEAEAEEAAKAEAEEAAKAEAEAAAKAEAEAAAAREEERRQQEVETEAAAARAAAAAQGMDARVRVLSDNLALPLKRLPGDHREQRFAVLPFENAGPEASERSLGIVVGDLVITNLVRDHRLRLVERSRIGAIMNELALQQSGAVDDSQALQLGKLAAVRGVVVGRVSDAGQDFLVSARVIDAESGAVLTSTDARLPKAELLAFSANAVVLRSKSGALFRSMVLPGWGQSYNGDDAKAFVLGGLTLGAAASTVVVGGLGLYNGFVVYPTADRGVPDDKRSATVVAVRETANAQLLAAGILAGITAVSWVVTAADAWVSGVDVDSLDAALARK